jgi:hypothetical protein
LAAKASYTLLISKLVSGKCFKSVELFRLINGVKNHPSIPPNHHQSQVGIYSTISLSAIFITLRSTSSAANDDAASYRVAQDPQNLTLAQNVAYNRSASATWFHLVSRFC